MMVMTSLRKRTSCRIGSSDHAPCKILTKETSSVFRPPSSSSGSLRSTRSRIARRLKSFYYLDHLNCPSLFQALHCESLFAQDQFAVIAVASEGVPLASNPESFVLGAHDLFLAYRVAGRPLPPLLTIPATIKSPAATMLIRALRVSLRSLSFNSDTRVTVKCSASGGSFHS